MDGRRRFRRNYDNFRENRVMTRTRNLDNFYSKNFGIYPRRQQQQRRSNNRGPQMIPMRPLPRGDRRGPMRSNRIDQGPRRRIDRRPLRNQRNNQPMRRNVQNFGNNPQQRQRQIRRRNPNTEIQVPRQRRVVDRRTNRRRAGPVGKLEISNLDPDVVNTDLLQIFSVYGRLKRCAVLFNEGASTGKGVVQYFSRVCAQRAQNDLNNTRVKGTNISVHLVQRQKKNNNNNNIEDNAAQDTNMKESN